jgi:hypothetical protein
MSLRPCGLRDGLRQQGKRFALAGYVAPEGATHNAPALPGGANFCRAYGAGGGLPFPAGAQHAVPAHGETKGGMPTYKSKKKKAGEDAGATKTARLGLAELFAGGEEERDGEREEERNAEERRLAQVRHEFFAEGEHFLGPGEMEHCHEPVREAAA